MRLTAERIQKALPLAVTLLVMAAYRSVLPFRLTDANNAIDSGDFLAAMLTGGIPHPTGYPTYTLLGWLIQHLPWQDAYQRALLLSWLPAALASGLLTLWVATKVLDGRSRRDWVAAALAGLVWGLSPILWSQAVIVEVHGLQSLIIITTLWWVTELLNWKKTRPILWRLLILAWLVGLGLGNHITLVLLGPACLYALWYAWRRGLSARWVLAQAGMTLLGLLVYLYLPLRAQTNPPVNWGNPQTLKGFWWLVSGSPYQSLLFNLPPMRLGERAVALASLLRDQFGLLGLMAVVIGAVQFEFSNRPLRWVLFWILGVYSLFSVIYATDDSTAYLIPVLLVVSVWLGLSVLIVWEIFYRKIPIGTSLVVVLAASLLWQMSITRQTVDPRVSDRPAIFAEQVLQSAPKNALVLTNSELDSFPLWYYHFGLHQRPDLAVVVLPLTQFVWYQQTVLHTYPDLYLPPVSQTDPGNQLWGEQIPALNPDRPLCNSQKDASASYRVTFTCLPK